MILNMIDVHDDLLDRYLSLSSLAGEGNMSLRQQVYIRDVVPSNSFPPWMCDLGMSFFGKASLERENHNLAARASDNLWLAGTDDQDVYPGVVSLYDLVLIGGNLLEEQFLGLWRVDGGLAVVASEDLNGRFVWVKIFDSFDDFLNALML